MQAVLCGGVGVSDGGREGWGLEGGMGRALMFFVGFDVGFGEVEVFAAVG